MLWVKMYSDTPLKRGEFRIKSLNITDGVRQQKMQKFIPVLEKYNVDLHMGGHQHNVSVSKPVKTGYNGTDPYNYYYDPNLSGTQPEYIDESNIAKKGNLAEGVTYVSVNSSGWKCSKLYWSF